MAQSRAARRIGATPQRSSVELNGGQRSSGNLGYTPIKAALAAVQGIRLRWRLNVGSFEVANAAGVDSQRQGHAIRAAQGRRLTDQTGAMGAPWGLSPCQWRQQNAKTGGNAPRSSQQACESLATQRPIWATAFLEAARTLPLSGT